MTRIVSISRSGLAPTLAALLALAACGGKADGPTGNADPTGDADEGCTLECLDCPEPWLDRRFCDPDGTVWRCRLDSADCGSGARWVRNDVPCECVNNYTGYVEEIEGCPGAR